MREAQHYVNINVPYYNKITLYIVHMSKNPPLWLHWSFHSQVAYNNESSDHNSL